MFCRYIGWYINQGIGSRHRFKAGYSELPLGIKTILKNRDLSVLCETASAAQHAAETSVLPPFNLCAP